MARWAIWIGGLLVFLVAWRVTVLYELAPWADYGVRGLCILGVTVTCTAAWFPSQVGSESQVSRLRADPSSILR